MKPVTNFHDHPALRYDEQITVFVIKHSVKPELYLYTDEEVKRILPLGLSYDNVGDPYKELVLFKFMNESKEDYIKIDPNDLQDLVNILKLIGVDFLIPERFNCYLDSYWED